MTTTASRIEKEIRRLPVEDMVELHERLIVTIHQAEEKLGLSDAWRKELERRAADINAGRAKGIPAELVFQKLNKKYS